MIPDWLQPLLTHVVVPVLILSLAAVGYCVWTAPMRDDDDD